MLRDGVLVGFVPEIAGSEDFDVATIVEPIATVNYDDPAHSDPGAAGVVERAPLGERGGLQETVPRTGGPVGAEPAGLLARFGKALRSR